MGIIAESKIITQKQGMDALGYPVPANRTNKTYELITETIDPSIDKDKARAIVGRCAELVKRDMSASILEATNEPLISTLDLCARYMVLASLLSD